MCRWTEEVGLTFGLPRHRHFVGFSNVPVQAPTRGQTFYGYFKNPPSYFRHLLLRAKGYRGPIIILNLPGPHGGIYFNVFLFIIFLKCFLISYIILCIEVP